MGALTAVLESLPPNRIRRLVLLGKTEGPATLNDFSRDLAMHAADAAIYARGGDELMTRSWRVFSTGCEGIATPTMLLFCDIDEAMEKPSTAPGDEPRLAFGAARSDPLPAPSLCNATHVSVAAATVRQAMAEANLTADQVRLVTIKSPVLSASAAATLGPAARRHGGSTGSSRGAAALGAAVALNEIDEAALDEDPVLRGTNFYSTRTMAFSGTETDRVEAVVFGERAGAGGNLRISSSPLSDLLDSEAVSSLVADFAPARPRAVLFKAGIPTDGKLRGRRTTVLGSDLPADKQLRAAASGLIGAWFGAADAFISGGAEHQGAPGNCLCALIGETPGAGEEN
jgi:cyanuric acid amidohydrolase